MARGAGAARAAWMSVVVDPKERDVSFLSYGVPARYARRRRPPLRAAVRGAVQVAALVVISGLSSPPVSAGEAVSGLTYAEALDLARQSAPALRAQQAALAGSSAAATAAASLPDPRLGIGVENLPAAGADRWRTTRDSMTMQRIALMQDVPNRAKRDAREQGAQARIERDRAALALAELSVRREAGLAWLGVHFAEARREIVDDVLRENRVLQDTLPARIAAGSAQPAELTMARQDALMIADRADDVARDIRKARAELRRWVGPRADVPLAGPGPSMPIEAAALRAALPHHAEIAPYAPMRAIAQAEVAEADAEQRGDWSWEVAYSRRPRYDDMVSFQLRFDLPWQRERRQQPLARAKRSEIDRLDAERDELLRRHGAEVDAMLADLDALDAQAERLRTVGQALASERVALALAAYEAGRGDLSAVLSARSQVLETRVRAIDLDAQRTALRVRLSTLIVE